MCNYESITSGSEQLLTLQTAGRALWDPRHCEAERKETHSVKQKNTRYVHATNHKPKSKINQQLKEFKV